MLRLGQMRFVRSASWPVSRKVQDPAEHPRPASKLYSRQAAKHHACRQGGGGGGGGSLWELLAAGRGGSMHAAAPPLQLQKPGMKSTEADG